jgi:hypothetical protein
MSTIYHDPIVIGAPANAATINAPLGELDSGIVTVDTRVSNIIASSGTSSTEVVDARTANYTSLKDRLDDIALSSNIFFVDPLFEHEPTAKRFTTISQAMLAASGNETIIIAPGIYAENVVLPANNISIYGGGQPAFDASSGRLVGGTIIRGRLRCGTRTGLTISNLGVDLVGVNSVDCIESTFSGSVDAWRKFTNLTLLGNGSDPSSSPLAYTPHGLYGDGNYLTIDNVHVIRCHHSIAIHGSYVNISNCIFERCTGSAVIVKSKGTADVLHVNIQNIVIRGNSSLGTWHRGGPIVVQSEDGRLTEFVNVSNVTASECINGVVQVTQSSPAGTVRNVTFTNIVSERNRDLAAVGDFWIKTGTRITFVNCKSLARVGGHGFNNDATGDATLVYVYDCTSDSSGAGVSNGTFTALEINRSTSATTNQRNQFTVAQGMTITKSVNNNTATDIADLTSASAAFISGAVLASIEVSGGSNLSAALYAVVWGYSTEAATVLSSQLFGHTTLTMTVVASVSNKRVRFTLTQVNPDAVACTVRLSVFPISAWWDNVMTLTAL